MRRTCLYKWCVVGAGPAGIAAVGQLLDQAINPKEILWIDPEFHVGDLGKKWPEVSSNTTVANFLYYLNFCKSFCFDQCPQEISLSKQNPSETCRLGMVVKPLQWISDHLSTKVKIQKSHVSQIKELHGFWQLHHARGIDNAKKVILAMGAEEKSLTYSNNTITVEDAMKPSKLQNIVSNQHTIGVFGNSHTGIVALYNLMNLNPKKVYLFYRSPLKFAIPLGDGYLYDNTGLKGYSADWAKENLLKNIPKNLSMVHLQDQEFEQHLSQCDFVVYAVGFEKRKSITLPFHIKEHFDPFTGIIAPGLFGCGIAYPEKGLEISGDYEYRVGLKKFMQFINRVLPFWMQYP